VNGHKVNATSAIENEFLELIEANRPRIRRISLVYGWTPQDAEDLYQEILFQIWRGLPNLREKSHANTWVYRVAINTGISYVRKTKSDRHTLPTDHGTLLEWADRHQEENQGHEQRDPRLEALYDALARLNKVEKGAVTLFMEGMSYEEIAEIMGTNANQVGVLLHRSKKKLFELMREVAV
jgi:RNA polymerase sigma-70 factor (ECF subfamily)